MPRERSHLASHLLSCIRVANTSYSAAIPTESDTESVADGQTTPKAEPSAQAKSELADTVMKDAKAQSEEEEEEETGDEETYEAEKILSHRADFDFVSAHPILAVSAYLTSPGTRHCLNRPL